MFDVKFYGVRGSYCTPRREMMGYGGSTSCVAVFKKNKAGLMVPLVIDTGNGAIALGHDLAKGIQEGSISPSFTLLWTHMHLDHIEGTPFFAPFFLPNVHAYLSGFAEEKYSPEKCLSAYMQQPFFPVAFEKLPAQKSFFASRNTFYIGQNGEPLEQKPSGAAMEPLFQIDVFKASSRLHPEPGALYYRISDSEDGARLVCIWDIEIAYQDEALANEYQALLTFAKNADLLIHDMMYSEEEYASRTTPVKGFGHSSYQMAQITARRTGAKQLAAFHYNPLHSDAMLDSIAQKISPLLIMAKEGTSITVRRQND
ncbi:MAG: hypothetical protein LBM77_08470 [Spirochaetaceae bacterium]|jgi:ribonuclease BN (tRNA processing enzyme)|nr:hypothetical protein [Spirochaetaceae bacterium]